MDDLEKRFNEVEARLVEQEHRLFPVLHNFFVSRKKWPEGDARRDAATKALIWRIFFSPGTIAVTGSFVGIVTLGVMVWQSLLIREQNQYFRQQITQQQQQLDAQQRVANQTIRSEAIERIYGPVYAQNPRVKAESVRSLVAVERLNIASGTNTLPTDYINLHEAQLEDAWLDSADLHKTSFRKTILNKAVLNSAKLDESSFRFTLAQGASFLSSDLHDAQFAFSDISLAQFGQSKLTRVLFSNCNLVGADFSNADLAESSFVGSDLASADFSNVQNWRQIRSIEGANIHNLTNAPAGFIEWAKAKGAVEMPNGLNIALVQAEHLRREEGPKARLPQPREPR